MSGIFRTVWQPYVKGHFTKVCQSKNITASLSVLIGISSEIFVRYSCRSNSPILVDGVSVNALVDTGSAISHISDNLIRKFDLQMLKDPNNCYAV